MPQPSCYHVYFKSYQTLDKVTFSAEIRLPESRRNLLLTPMYITMATLASQKARKISKSRILEFS